MENKKEKSASFSALSAFETLFHLKEEFPVCPEYTSLTEKDKAYLVVNLLRFRENLKNTNMYSYTWYKDARKLRNHFAHITETLGTEDFDLIVEMYDNWLDQALEDLYCSSVKIFSSNPSIKKFGQGLSLEKIEENKNKTVQKFSAIPLSENLKMKYSEIYKNRKSELHSSYKKLFKKIRKSHPAKNGYSWTFENTLAVLDGLYKSPRIGPNFSEYNAETGFLNNLRLYSKNFEGHVSADFSECHDGSVDYVLTLPEGITSIEPFAFDFLFLSKISKNKNTKKYSLPKIRFSKIRLPDSLATVSEAAFANLKGNTKIFFGDSVKVLSTLAFHNSDCTELVFPLSEKLKIYQGALDYFPVGNETHTKFIYDGTDISAALNFEQLDNHFVYGKQPDFPFEETFDFYRSLSATDREAYELFGNRILLRRNNFLLKNDSTRKSDILLDCGHMIDYISFGEKDYLVCSKKITVFPDGTREEKAGCFYLASEENFNSEYYEENLIPQKKHSLQFVHGIKDGEKIKGGAGFEITGNRPVMIFLEI